MRFWNHWLLCWQINALALDWSQAAYLRKAAAGIGQRRSGGAPAPSLTDSDETDLWPNRLKGWRESRTWVESLWGPMPGRDGCRVPAELLSATSERP